MPFFQDNKSAIIGAVGTIGGAIIGGLLTFTFQFWNKPDLRYEEMPYYQGRDASVVCLKLTNFGWQDAEKIKVRAAFPKPLTQEPQTSDATCPLVSSTKELTGHEKVTGEIERVVPGQDLYVFFGVQGEHGPTPVGGVSFVEGISHKGGLAKTGRPISWPSTLLFAFMAFLSGVAISGIVSSISNYMKIRAASKGAD